jgi:hypothetical protein
MSEFHLDVRAAEPPSGTNDQLAQQHQPAGSSWRGATCGCERVGTDDETVRRRRPLHQPLGIGGNRRPPDRADVKIWRGAVALGDVVRSRGSVRSRRRLRLLWGSTPESAS